MTLRMEILSYLQKTIWPQKPEIIIFGDAKSGTTAAAKLLGKACKKVLFQIYLFCGTLLILKFGKMKLQSQKN